MSDSKEPGFFTRFVRSTFAFRKTTLTALVVLSYIISILITAYFEHAALRLPSKDSDSLIYLTDSWIDLQVISRTFHPYDSHANDDVHDYILERVEKLAETKDYITFDDQYGKKSLFSKHDDFDPTSTINRVIYFEGGNILVKITGKNPDLADDGVLISAHYDSVPTAKGTTDDGMGIASMLGILEYYSLDSTPQPERTIVFNFNNNEEFGLLGAYTFFDHKWSKIVKYFINLEGTGAGGRSILFRSTDYGVLSYYKAASKPFANSLFEQGFKSGIIRSQTDYKVYTENGLRGMDIAFFRPRSLYHTGRDSITGTTKGSLWHMEKNALDTLNAMAFEKEILNDDTTDAVFFDVLGKYFVCVPITTLYILDILLLVTFPVLTILSLIVIYRRGTWYLEVGKGFFRFPISLAISSTVIFIVAKHLFYHDPLVLSNDYTSALLSFTSLFVISNYLVLNFSAWARPVHDQKLIGLLELNFLFWILKIYFTVKEQKGENVASYAITIVYTLVSVASLFGLIALMCKSKPKYERRFNNPIVYGSTENSVHPGSSASSSHVTNDPNGKQNQQNQASTDSNNNQDSPSSSSSHDNTTIANSGEQSALLENGGRVIVYEEESYDSFQQKLKSAALTSFNYDWSLQFLTVVPLSILVFWNLGDLLLEALHNAVQETAELGALTTNGIVALAIFLGLPLLPFIHKLNAALTIFSLVVFLVATSIAYFEEPFSYNNPLKLSFLQYVDLTNGSLPIVQVAGRSGFVEPVLEQIPHINMSEVWCKQNVKNDYDFCYFEGQRPWVVDGTEADNKFSNLLNIEVIKDTNKKEKGSKDGNAGGGDKYGPLEAEIKINAKANRNCVLTFNTTKYNSIDSPYNSKLISPIKIVSIYDDKNANASALLKKRNYNDEKDMFSINTPAGHSTDPVTGTEIFKLMNGIDEIQLHKVDWDQDSYHIGLSWMFSWDDDDDDEDENGELSGAIKDRNIGISVKCYWGEYDGEVRVDGARYRMMPAFDDLLQYSPDYITYSNSAKGLFEIDEYVEL